MRKLPIFTALRRLGTPNLSIMRKFEPYVLDKNLQATEKFSGLREVSTRDFSRDNYKQDNQMVNDWFEQFKDDFYLWRSTATKYTDIPDLRIELLGGRHFDTSYPEESVHCAIVSEDFKSFLQFCVFVNLRYAQQQLILSGKSEAGIPEMIVKGPRSSKGFQCERLTTMHPRVVAPELLISYMSPAFYGEYFAQQAGFFCNMSESEVNSYLHNMRYFKHLSKQPLKDVRFEGKPVFQALKQVLALLGCAHQPNIDNLQAKSPEFNSEVLKSVVSFAALSLSRDTGLTAFSSKKGIGCDLNSGFDGNFRGPGL